jgi:hypothetical protein
MSIHPLWLVKVAAASQIEGQFCRIPGTGRVHPFDHLEVGGSLAPAIRGTE